jgi:hypothetical protein
MGNSRKLPSHVEYLNVFRFGSSTKFQPPLTHPTANRTKFAISNQNGATLMPFIRDTGIWPGLAYEAFFVAESRFFGHIPQALKCSAMIKARTS